MPKVSKQAHSPETSQIETFSRIHAFKADGVRIRHVFVAFMEKH
jgi:hypothetical protein